jgi:hypothetical protein
VLKIDRSFSRGHLSFNKNVFDLKTFGKLLNKSCFYFNSIIKADKKIESFIINLKEKLRMDNMYFNAGIKG